MPPEVLAKGSDRPNGVLPVTAATRAASAKAPTARLKLEIRRLPPGLTLTEFEEILGPEWTLGKGKVDWREYRQGKLKQGIGKVPEQSRCYIHLVSEPLVKEFEAVFFRVVFHDKAGTYRSPDLKHLPPTIGFAPNQRTPLSVKPKVDNRQGTIDQDPEFIRFLEAETQPIVKPAALDTVGAEKEKPEKVETTSTPLIEAIREKKANKAKAAAAKEEKREAKSHSKSESKDASSGDKAAGKGKNTDAQKNEPTPKDAGKAGNKSAAKQKQQRAAASQPAQEKPNHPPAKSKKAAQGAKAQGTETPAISSPEKTASTPTSQRGQRQRGNPDAIKKIFQKDLGIKPATSTPSKDSAASGNKSTPATAADSSKGKNSEAQPQPTPSTSKGSQNNASSASSKQDNQASASVNATKAYLKHANPSQGMTDVLIQQALSVYGEVTSVTIDPRKGTAVAVFKDAQGLQKARDAKKVTVASGTIEVHEFKDRGGSGGGGRGGFRGNRSGGRGGKGGAQAAPNAASSDAPKAAS